MMKMYRQKVNREDVFLLQTAIFNDEITLKVYSYRRPIYSASIRSCLSETLPIKRMYGREMFKTLL